MTEAGYLYTTRQFDSGTQLGGESHLRLGDRESPVTTVVPRPGGGHCGGISFILKKEPYLVKPEFQRYSREDLLLMNPNIWAFV
jgi:hypothetical protein